MKYNKIISRLIILIITVSMILVVHAIRISYEDLENDCVNRTVREENRFNEYQCEQSYSTSVCSEWDVDPPLNKSCLSREQVITLYNSTCYSGYTVFIKECVPTGKVKVSPTQILDIDRFPCLINEDLSTPISRVIDCVSLDDGDGKLPCTKGESCIRYEIDEYGIISRHCSNSEIKTSIDIQESIISIF